MTMFWRFGQWLTRKAAVFETTREVTLGSVRMALSFGREDLNSEVKRSMLPGIMLSFNVDTLGKRLMQSKRATASVGEVYQRLPNMSTLNVQG